VLQHRTPVISERLSKSNGFCDRQSLQLRRDDFLFGVPPLTAFHIPGKAPGTYRHRLYGLPRIPLPGHTRKIEFPKMMSSYKFSLCGSNLSFAGILFFLIFLFRRCSLLLYTQQQLASLSTDFIKQRAYELGHSCPYTDLDCQDCPQLNNCPMDAGTEEWFQLLVELDRRRSVK
jgi:hypothetical protein